MISWDRFLSLVIDPSLLNRRIDRDNSQLDAVSAGSSESLFIVAGPGSGKTTVLALRVLKLVFVDNIEPSAIMATTFTRKAATELRSRILGWGDQLRQAIVADARTESPLQEQLERLDINRVVTGTLDSIAEQTLGEIREAGTQPPIPLEEFVANAILRNAGLFADGRYRNTDLEAYLQRLQAGTSLGAKLKVTREVRDRFLHDRVDRDAFEGQVSRTWPGVSVLCEAIRDYELQLDADLVMDFAALEDEFLRRITSGQLERFAQSLQAILVDEYQDTNLLQEQIYFGLARAVSNRGGSITVVGDDDQSLYRFRGATVELFTDYPRRLQASPASITARTIYLSNNYRSTDTVVSWFSDYINLDPEYSVIRVSGKPSLSVARPEPFVDCPVLGLFRPDVDTLARDLAVFIDEVFNRGGYAFLRNGESITIIKNPDRGAIGDCALLLFSPKEFKENGDPRLPALLRQELGRLTPPIEVFNPRGQELNRISVVQRLCGLMLECIDPSSRIQNSIPNLPPSVPRILDIWRNAANDFIATDPPAPPRSSGVVSRNTLQAFVQAWRNRVPQRGGQWPREVPLIDLLYELITWMPVFQEDPEGLVYLEVITRTIMQSARLILYDATIRRDQPQADRSVKAILWGIFVPIALGEVEINEELIEVFPRDRLSMMSIHQAKGLEFPLTIVDIGSEFRGNYWRTQGFKRFPLDDVEDGIKARGPILENELRPFSPLGVPTRSRRDRDFDDLVRGYFVAFSRAQDVLLLVGQSDNTGNPRNIPNVAAGWRRDRQWPWRGLPRVTFI